MQIIQNMSQMVLDSSSLQQYNSSNIYIKSPYLKIVLCEDGNLVYNTLTNELILISAEEFENPAEKLKEWLVNHCFYFSSDYNPKLMSDVIHSNINEKYPISRPEVEHIVIASTTVCNARCYYCYECDMKTQTMTEEVIENVSKYIQNIYNNNRIQISWFGGEPLCNPNAIRKISSYLKTNSVNYSSTMISNGYLLNNFDIDEIKNEWKLRSIQITLDGTKTIYQNSKAYVNNDENAYEHVLDNIEYMVTNGINVTIRLNVSKNNGEDLLELIEYLANRFGDYKNFSIYPRELFLEAGNPPLKLTEEEEMLVADNMINIIRRLSELKLMFLKEGISGVPRHQCMADSGLCKVICPSGNLSVCEHYLEETAFGDVNSPINNQELFEEWKEQINDSEDCGSCLYYPRCVRLKKCPVTKYCTQGLRKVLFYTLDIQILKAYERWKNKRDSGDNNPIDEVVVLSKDVEIDYHPINCVINEQI